ncbi:hypothetical protein D3C81_1678020 [compost metagenome]
MVFTLQQCLQQTPAALPDEQIEEDQQPECGIIGGRIIGKVSFKAMLSDSECNTDDITDRIQKINHVSNGGIIEHFDFRQRIGQP